MQMRGRGRGGPAPRPPGLRGSCSAAGTVKVAPIGRDGESAPALREREGARALGAPGSPSVRPSVHPRRRRGCAPLAPFPACARLRQLASCAAGGGRRERFGGERREERGRKERKKEKREGKKGGGNLPLVSLENDT